MSLDTGADVNERREQRAMRVGAGSGRRARADERGAWTRPRTNAVSNERRVWTRATDGRGRRRTSCPQGPPRAPIARRGVAESLKGYVKRSTPGCRGPKSPRTAFFAVNRGRSTCPFALGG